MHLRSIRTGRTPSVCCLTMKSASFGKVSMQLLPVVAIVGPLWLSLL